jgi:hypothetical protein
MNAYTHLVELVDSSAGASAQEAARRIATQRIATQIDPDRICLRRWDGWAAVPAEDARLTVPSARTLIARALKNAGGSGFGVVLDPRITGTPVGVPPTEDGVEELARRFGVVPFVLVPRDGSWGLTQTKDEFLIATGPPSLVGAVLGESAEEAVERFNRYVRSPGWSATAVNTFSSILQLLAVDYPRARAGECVTIPVP